MSARTIKLLHIEDDPMQQLLTCHYLGQLSEFHFDITTADSEDQAVQEFRRNRHEIVLLDYHLTQGNGLSCLRQLRQEDRIVPIVAISGTATPEIAAELLKVGADDYLSKEELTPENLAQSVRTSLARPAAWRRETAPATADPALKQAAALFEALCQGFAASNGPDLLTRLDAFEAAARQAHLSAEQAQQLFESACAAVGGDTRRLLRPLFLEVVVRLFGDEAESTREARP